MMSKSRLERIEKKIGPEKKRNPVFLPIRVINAETRESIELTVQLR